MAQTRTVDTGSLNADVNPTKQRSFPAALCDSGTDTLVMTRPFKPLLWPALLWHVTVGHLPVLKPSSTIREARVLLAEEDCFLGTTLRPCFHPQTGFSGAGEIPLRHLRAGWETKSLKVAGSDLRTRWRHCWKNTLSATLSDERPSVPASAAVQAWMTFGSSRGRRTVLRRSVAR